MASSLNSFSTERIRQERVDLSEATAVPPDGDNWPKLAFDMGLRRIGFDTLRNTYVWLLKGEIIKTSANVHLIESKTGQKTYTTMEPTMERTYWKIKPLMR
jgi:hypothetical protein